MTRRHDEAGASIVGEPATRGRASRHLHGSNLYRRMEAIVRSITCLFFAVVTLMLGNIRAGVGQPNDAVPLVAALVFGIAAVVFAVLDWPGLPRTGVEVPVE